MKKAFTEIIGNRTLCTRLANDVLADKLPHALILEGKGGTGKHTIARHTAAALHCESKNDPTRPIPCLQCSACRKIMEGKAPDFITVGRDGKATIGVDTVRFLREDVHVIPNDAERKIYVIEDADRMTDQAQNALLLTLEEPPAYVHFLLLCENAELFLETIRSRAPVLRTEPIPRDQVDAYLQAHERRAVQMKMADPRGYAELLAASGVGIGQALDYLEPKTFAPVKQIRSLAADLVRAAVSQDGAKATLPVLRRFSSKRDLLRDQLNAVQEAVRDLILLKKNDEASCCFWASREEAEELCDRAPMLFLYELHTAIATASEECAHNANVRLCLIKMALSAGLLGNVEPI